jgi:D-psicose/D-tagatose/L-ribulose 3-epimerase
MKFGVNTWVWTAPLTTEDLEKLVPQVAGMGFDWIEFPLEEIGGFDPSTRPSVAPGKPLPMSAPGTWTSWSIR